MRHAQPCCTEFGSCYLQQWDSIDLFSYRTLGHGQNGHMNKVCPSFCSEVCMVLGAHVVLCMTEQDFLKKMSYPQNGENKPGPGFFKCIGKFSFFLSSLFFLPAWSIMKVCVTVILVFLSKFHIWENSGS